MRNDKIIKNEIEEKKTLISSFNLTEKVLVLAERLTRKDALGRFYKNLN